MVVSVWACKAGELPRAGMPQYDVFTFLFDALCSRDSWRSVHEYLRNRSTNMAFALFHK